MRSRWLTFARKSLWARWVSSPVTHLGENMSTLVESMLEIAAQHDELSVDPRETSRESERHREEDRRKTDDRQPGG